MQQETCSVRSKLNFVSPNQSHSKRYLRQVRDYLLTFHRTPLENIQHFAHEYSIFTYWIIMYTYVSRPFGRYKPLSWEKNLMFWAFRQVSFSVFHIGQTVMMLQSLNKRTERNLKYSWSSMRRWEEKPKCHNHPLYRSWLVASDT